MKTIKMQLSKNAHMDAFIKENLKKRRLELIHVKGARYNICDVYEESTAYKGITSGYGILYGSRTLHEVYHILVRLNGLDSFSEQLGRTFGL